MDRRASRSQIGHRAVERDHPKRPEALGVVEDSVLCATGYMTEGHMETLIQGGFEIADICLASAFSKARFGLRKPGFFIFFRGKSFLVEMDLA